MIVIFIVKVSNLIAIYDWKHHVYISFSLFIYSTHICIKVFKTKCGDKILMWVMVFWKDWKMYLLKMLLLLLRKRRRRKIKWTFFK